MNLTRMPQLFFVCFLFVIPAVGFSKDKNDFIEVLIQDKPADIVSYLDGLAVTSYKIKGLTKKTYYAFDDVKLKLGGIPLSRVTFSFFDSKIGHILASFEGEKNKEALLKKLTESFGVAKIEKDEDLDSNSYTWKAKGSFIYELYYVKYSKSASISIENDDYRKVNAR